MEKEEREQFRDWYKKKERDEDKKYRDWNTSNKTTRELLQSANKREKK